MAHSMSTASRIFALIKQATEIGNPCPTNVELAERLGLASGSTVARSIGFMETAGMLTVERGSNSRVVTICATGKATAGKPESVRLADIDAFADLLADNASVPEASRLMNWSARDGHKALALIRRGLGAQAA